MSWGNVLLLAILVLVLALTTVRSVARRRFLIVFFLDLPVGVLLVRWASYRSEWAELAAAFASGAIAFLIWWLAYGRRLAAPRDDNIRVWTDDDSP